MKEKGVSDLSVREGELYKVITVGDRKIEIRYGYYEEFERRHGEPVPIYPDFTKQPIYTEDGMPLVTAMQEVCVSFIGGDREMGCYSCRHYRHIDDLVGKCEKRNNITEISEGDKL